MSADDPLRVVVAERHEATRTGIRAALERAGFAVVAECGEGSDPVAAVRRERADVCLLDAEFADAAELVESLLGLPSRPKVVLLASAVDEAVLFRALRGGAVGFLLKDIGAARLAEELRSVAEGGIALSPAVAARLVEDLRRRSQRRAPAPGGLTEREWEVLGLLAEGLSTKEAAGRLRVSPTTVRRHLSSAIKRLGAASRRNAIEWLKGVQEGERE